MGVRVGLTGGVASGKSTVSAILRGLGAVVIDGDVLAREVVARGTPGLDAVVAEFGPGLLTPEGDLDRPAMGRLVFGSSDGGAARRRLEAIVHPLVYERIQELEAEAPAGTLVVHDIPLLAENGREGDFDAVIVVEVPEETQVERMVGQRGWTEQDARARIAAQATPGQRRAIATYLIDNTGTREDLRDRVTEVFDQLRTARRPPSLG